MQTRYCLQNVSCAPQTTLKRVQYLLPMGSCSPGSGRHEKVEILAKQSLKRFSIDIQVPLSKVVIQTIINEYNKKTWEEYLDLNDTGRHLYRIQKHVGTGERSKGEKDIIHLRIGNTGLNDKIGKPPTGLCSVTNIIKKEVKKQLF